METSQQLLKSIDGHDIRNSMGIQVVLGSPVKLQPWLKSNPKKTPTKLLSPIPSQTTAASSPGTGMRTSSTDCGSKQSRDGHEN